MGGRETVDGHISGQLEQLENALLIVMERVEDLERCLGPLLRPGDPPSPTGPADAAPLARPEASVMADRVGSIAARARTIAAAVQSVVERVDL